MSHIQAASKRDSIHITRRLLRCLPASRFEMQTLTHLAGIVATEDIPTASVECKRRPRMLINPKFVAEYCERDEHLFLLVMHELWHVLLAHTRMYPISTPAHNIAFDAVINAGLMAKFNTPEYMGFFDKLYPADQFPGCLLRPPVGWPQMPEYPQVGPKGTRGILRRLYPRRNLRSRQGQKPLYEEILALLLSSDEDLAEGTPMLLGNHDGTPLNPDGSPVNDPFMKEALKNVMQDWSPMVMDGENYGGSSKNNWKVDIAPDYANAKRVFSNALKRAVGQQSGRAYRKARTPISDTGGHGVLPNPRDRQLHARKKLGSQSLLYAQQAQAYARLPERPALTHIYLDVSGSMSNILPHLLRLLIPYVKRQEALVFQFSTTVDPLSLTELRSGQLTTTGGTNLNCVLEHMLDGEEKIQKALLVTDGGLGTPNPILARRFKEAPQTLLAVLPADCRLHPRAAPLIKDSVELPPAG